MDSRTQGTRFVRTLTGDFTQLLISLLLFILIYPLLLSSAPGLLVLNIFLFLLMLSALRAIGHDKKIFRAAILLFMLSVLFGILLFLWPSRNLSIVSTMLQMLFFTTISLSLLHHVMQSDELTAEHLSCALCVYIFLGIIWAGAYFTVEIASPGSFNLPTIDGVRVNSWTAGSHLHFAILYYSFMTMATVGYGDIAPLTPFARSLAVLEVIIGQFYLAVLIGRIVGSFIGIRRKRGTGAREKAPKETEEEA
jgi:hypothetical protein